MNTEINNLSKDLPKNDLYEKLHDKQKKKAKNHFLRYYGASKIKTTDEQLHKAREEVAKELAKEFNVDLSD